MGLVLSVDVYTIGIMLFIKKNMFLGERKFLAYQKVDLGIKLESEQ